MDIRSDRQKGLSYTEIARKYNLDPRTAKKYAESETRPVYSLSAAKPSKLDPPVQGADRNMAGGSTVLGGADSGKDPGAGL